MAMLTAVVAASTSLLHAADGGHHLVTALANKPRNTNSKSAAKWEEDLLLPHEAAEAAAPDMDS
uniref:Uncharacterized protein n=1 Tax=Oryza sativa subsp. japonica TaxID=39947 RepID=Q6K511_ORYSJ|nr:hypothetical protein [Oryza sativa Japonica Group]